MSNETPKANQVKIGFTQVDPKPTDVSQHVGNRQQADRAQKATDAYAKATLDKFKGL